MTVEMAVRCLEHKNCSDTAANQQKKGWGVFLLTRMQQCCLPLAGQFPHAVLGNICW
jgi:hypothetical protein